MSSVLPGRSAPSSRSAVRARASRRGRDDIGGNLLEWFDSEYTLRRVFPEGSIAPGTADPAWTAPTPGIPIPNLRRDVIESDPARPAVSWITGGLSGDISR